MKRKNLPGSLWKSHGAWHWRVSFPGESGRKDYALTMPATGERIPADASRSLAESAAWRLWEEHVKQPAEGAPVFTVNDLSARWAAHASAYYAESDEAAESMAGMRTFRKLYGNRPIESMTHLDMLAYRDALVAKGYVRSTVNKRIGYVKRMVAWGLDERLVSAQTKSELTAISPVKPRRTKAKESTPVQAVPDADIEATAAALVPSVGDMIRVHRLTGMRPDELCQLAWPRIERRWKIWIFRPERHKGRWRNKPRVIVIGPRAQRIIARHPGDGYVFSPQAAVMEVYERTVAAAKCHRRPEKVKGVPRKAGDRWNVSAYDRAIKRGAEKAGVAHWSANQLRHTCATEIRRSMGMMAASAVLGHTLGLRITDRYSFEAAEDEIIKAATPAMLKMG